MKLTPERIKEQLAAVEALLKGEYNRVQWYDKNSERWLNWPTETDKFLGDVDRPIRIKPEPKLRPWTFHEIPVGQLLKTPDGQGLIVAGRIYNGGTYVYIGRNWELNVKHLALDLNYQHSLDQGKTWLPCGVVE
jgi:hypothetical protein